MHYWTHKNKCGWHLNENTLIIFHEKYNNSIWAKWAYEVNKKKSIYQTKTRQSSCMHLLILSLYWYSVSSCHPSPHIDGLVQQSSSSTAHAMEACLWRIELLIWLLLRSHSLNIIPLSITSWDCPPEKKFGARLNWPMGVSKGATAALEKNKLH